MMKNIVLMGILCLCGLWANAQELYVFSEPASNMPAKSIGLRATAEGMQQMGEFRTRTVAEAMVGINKNFMLHLQGFASDMDGQFNLEGASLYAKYRFLSVDDLHSHFRGAVFGRISSSKRPTFTEDINLEGDNQGWQAGAVFTQLIHKLALSGTVAYNRTFDDLDKVVPATLQPKQMINYNLSSGYLLLPFVYKNYNQPNFNLYVELLGKTNPDNGHSYLDIAPAVQFIINSRTRFDFGYRFQAYGNIENRYLKNMFLLRTEFNFFNIL